MEWNKKNKEFIINKEESEWEKIHGSTKKMFWDGKWYKKVGGKLVKIK